MVLIMTFLHDDCIHEIVFTAIAVLVISLCDFNYFFALGLWMLA